MKKFFWMVAAATALFASCAKDATTDVLPAPEATEDFTATFDMSRAELDGTVVKWNDGDLITIFTKTNHNRQYKAYSLTEDDRSAKFSYTNVFTQGDGSAISANYAVYPYDAEATISGNEITTKINAEQAYNANKVDLSNSLMVAKSSNLTLSFVNAGGLLRFKVAKENLPDVYKLKSINVTSQNNNLAGKVTIDTGADSKAVVVAEGASKSVELTGIDATIEQEAQLFYLALPATNFAEGDKLYFTFAVNGDEQTLWEKEITLPAFELKQNAIKTISYTIKAEDEFTGVTPDSDMPEVYTAEDLANALANPNIDEVTLMDDIEVNEPLVIGETVTRAAVRTVTLNLNGKSLTAASGNVIQNHGNLTITGNGEIISASTYGLNNSGTAVVNGAKINAIYTSGNLTVEMATIENTINGKHGIYHCGESLVINDGVFSTTANNELIHSATNNATINGGTFTQLGKSYLLSSNIVVNDGVFNGYVNEDGSNDTMRPGVEVNGGVFNFDPSKWTDEENKSVEVNGEYVVVPEEVNPVADADALVEALENDLDVTFYSNIKIDPANMSNAYGKTGINVLNGQTIDGNGFVLDIKGAGGTWDSGINTTGGLIKNITITGSFRGIFVNHNGNHSELVVLENVTIDGTTYTISCDQAKEQGLKATNSTFKGWTSYAATLGTAEFIDCYFGKGNGYAFCRPYAPTTFENCDFEAGYEMDPRAAVTFKNCKLDGVLLTAENLATLVTSNIANATVIE